MLVLVVWIICDIDYLDNAPSYSVAWKILSFSVMFETFIDIFIL